VDRVEWITEITTNGRQQAVLAVIDTTMKLSVKGLQAAVSIIKQHPHNMAARSNQSSQCKMHTWQYSHH